jgi:hypothetical protein
MHLMGMHLMRFWEVALFVNIPHRRLAQNNSRARTSGLIFLSNLNRLTQLNKLIEAAQEVLFGRPPWLVRWLLPKNMQNWHPSHDHCATGKSLRLATINYTPSVL